ncbi:MAG: TraB/GumN family protein [Steroidobacteraceae bacterium]
MMRVTGASRSCVRHLPRCGYISALDSAGLTRRNEIEQTVIALARRHHIPVQHARLQVDDPLSALKQVRALSPALEVDCLASTVSRLQTDLPAMQQRARAWAVGDVERLRALPFPDQRQVCIAALSAAPAVKTLVDSASEAWISAAESALNAHRVSFALRPIYDLLAANGPLARFRAEGYEVHGPE